jgi:pimeloyl-ACP methyl ester carboxylesterase
MHLAGDRVKKERLSSSSQCETATQETEQIKVGIIPALGRARTPLRPLIFVPGVSASTLAKKIKTDKNGEQWQYFWPPPWHLSPQDQNKIMLEGVKSKYRSHPNDQTSVKAMGLYPRAYDYLINALELFGYRLNVNFWIFPYDWRQSNRVSGRQLADFIEDKVSESNSTQGDGYVDIINHSMGGFVTRAAAKLYGAPISRAVYIASPHYGCPLSYFTLREGIPYDEYTLIRLIEYGVIPGNGIKIDLPTMMEARKFNKGLEDAFKELPSMYELLPDRFYLEKVPLLYSDDEPAIGEDETYFEGEWKFTEHDAISRIKDAMKFKRDELGEYLPTRDNLIIYGMSSLPTYDTIVYQKRFFVSSDKSKAIFPDEPKKIFSCPYASGQGGDTWVPKLSGMGSMTEKEIKKSKHFDDTHILLPNNIDVIREVLRFLSDTGHS